MSDEVSNLKIKNPLMLLPAFGVILAGIVLIVTPITAIFLYQTISTNIGIVLLLIFSVIGVWEMSLFRSISGSQVGEYPGIVKTLVVAILLRIISILITEDLLLLLNLAAMALEASGLGIVYLNRKAFMPSDEEVAYSLKRFSSVTVKVVAQCPKCSGVVEADWALCPECGTHLPRFCVDCGSEIRENDKSCCKCGKEIEVPASLIKTVDTLRKTAELDAAPETRSARYARLGEGLLKIGQLDEAVEAFKIAIQYTQFERKRTNFMVKMAVVMANKGRLQEAEQLLDAAMKMDPEDIAGAAKTLEELRKPAVCPA